MSDARPIIMSAPMVHTVLAGTKSQTRRLVKPQPDTVHDGWPYWYIGGYRAYLHMGVTDPLRSGSHNPLKCPHGRIGDLLWVREAWRIGAWDEENQSIAVDYVDGPNKAWRQLPLTPEGQELFDRLWVQSSDECRKLGIKPNTDGNYRWEPGESPLRWRPSIHMPRWASRITLLIEDVRVDRLQEISEADAMAEGVTPAETTDGDLGYALGFIDLWESVHGSDSWDANPLVWRIKFRPILQNVDAYMREAA